MSQKLKILAVDDEDFNLDIIKEYLEDAGYEVVTAVDGVDALDKLSQHSDVSAIVLDRMMPNMDGMTMLKHLHADPILDEIPIIMQTAAASSKQIQEGIDAGVYYYLAKPYNESLLLSIVRAALKDDIRRKELRDQLRKQKHTLGLIEKAQFKFRTLEEANNISYFVVNCFSGSEHMVYGLNELMVNSIEHGNLELGYYEKRELMLAGKWQQEIERRLKLAQYENRYVVLEYVVSGKEVVISIKDEGKGFEWKNYLELSPSRAHDPNGRGIAVAKMKAFPNLEYVGCGNQVICRVDR